MRQLAGRRTLRFVALGLLTLAAGGCAVASAPAALMHAGQTDMAAGLRLLLPATTNYSDPTGPRYSGDTAAPPPPAEELVVVTYNLRYAEAIDAAVTAFAEAQPLPSAGIILLQEMDAAGVVALAEAWQMHYVYYPASVADDGDDFGNAILSRWPLSAPAKIILPGLHPLTGQQRTATRATTQVGERKVLLYSVHIETATAPVSLRLAQMAAVLADVPGHAEAVIIGGDFNTVTARGVAGLATAHAAGDMAHATGDLGPTVTRFGLRPSAADHLFVRGFEVLDAGVLGEVTASDHFPVWARLANTP